MTRRTGRLHRSKEGDGHKPAVGLLLEPGRQLTRRSHSRHLGGTEERRCEGYSIYLGILNASSGGQRAEPGLDNRNCRAAHKIGFRK